MSTAIDLMKGGLSSGTAKAINGQTNSSITAGTTQTQAGATTLTASNNIITTVTTAGDGVVLSDTEIGDSYEILCGFGRERGFFCLKLRDAGEQEPALDVDLGVEHENLRDADLLRRLVQSASVGLVGVMCPLSRCR